MATAAMAYGERRFGAAYTIRIFVVLVVFGFVAGMWGSEHDPRVTSHPTLLRIPVALGLAAVTFWIAMGKSAVVISDSGVRRESLFGQQEIAWSQVAETCY